METQTRLTRFEIHFNETENQPHIYKGEEGNNNISIAYQTGDQAAKI